MNISLILPIILFFTGYLSLINTNNSSDNQTLTMLILTTTIQSSPLVIKRRSSVEILHITSNSTDEINQNNVSSSLNELRPYDNVHTYSIIKDGSNLTKTQIKVIVTVVIIISFIMFIIAIFRFKNACRDQETPSIQTEILRQRISLHSEPSSRRGSIGYYTRKYIRPSDIRLDEQLNTSLSNKRFSVPVCNQSLKSKTNPVLASTPRESASTIRTSTHHCYVPLSCNSSNPTDNPSVSNSVKPSVRKSCSTIGITQNKLPVIVKIFFSHLSLSLTILSIHRQSRRLILCTVPPHILCRPNTVRYSLVFNVHDQRQRRRTTSNRYIKVSSPTLRKLCLPCISTRNQQHHHHHNHPHTRQQSNKNKTLAKNNQRQTITVPTAVLIAESNVVESSHRLEVAPRTCDPISTTPVVHSSEYLRENDVNHSHEQQQHQHFETSLPNEKIEKKDDEVSVIAEVLLTKVDSEPVLLTLSSSGNEIARSNEDDVCDDQTPLLTSELATTIKDSSNRTTRKYSLNAFLPLTRSSNPHPLSSSSTTPTAFSSNTAGDEKKIRHSLDLKSRRRLSLTSAFRRTSFAKQIEPTYSTIDSNNITSLPQTSLPNSSNHQPSPLDSDSSDRTSLLKTNKISTSKNHLRKKSSTITPIASSYQKDFMQKIERFRFIDDSASSTTTVTSPVESIDRINSHQQPCSHLITSAIEQFDDYVRSRYHQNDDIDSYIDRLNSDILTNGSYSDLNILNTTNNNNNNGTIQRPQTIQQHITFKPVNHLTSQLETNDYRQTIHSSAAITIPSQHSKHVYPSDNSIVRPTTITTNGHSRSMDFQSNKHELVRPITLTNIGTIYETSSSSIATVTTVRSSTSLEFNDDSKPSGVLVDDDFLPMSSPVDEHFWDMTTPTNHPRFLNHKNECFPNVGSSPDIEVKHFDVHQINPFSSSSMDQPLSETSCDDEDDDVDDDRSLNEQKFSIHEYKLKELQKPIVIHRSVFNPSMHSTDLGNDLPIKQLSLDRPNDESLLEKFASSNIELVPIPIRSPPLRATTTGDIILSSQQYPQTIYEEDDTQESSTNDNISDESADNGEIDLVQEFELSQKQEQTNNDNNDLWNTNDRDIFILQEDDILSALVTTPTQQINRPPPASIMKIAPNKSLESIDEQQSTSTSNSLKPKVRFNLDPQYEREREWNKVNKLLGNSVEWTDEFEV